MARSQGGLLSGWDTGAWASTPAWPGVYCGLCPILSFKVPGRSGLLAKPKSGPSRLRGRTQDTAQLGCYPGAVSQVTQVWLLASHPTPRPMFTTPYLFRLRPPSIRQNPLPPTLPLCGFPVFIACFSGSPRPLACLYPNPNHTAWPRPSPSSLPTLDSAPLKQMMTWSSRNTYAVPHTVPCTVRGALHRTFTTALGSGFPFYRG